MARAFWSLIARADSQLIPRWRGEATLAQSLRQRVNRDRSEIHSFCPTRVVCDDELIARQGLAAHDLAQVIGKMFERRQAA